MICLVPYANESHVRGGVTKADSLHCLALLTQRLYLLLLFSFYCALSQARTKAYPQHPQLAHGLTVSVCMANETKGTEGKKDLMTHTQLHKQIPPWLKKQMQFF